jgi:hypothetical protein
VADVGDRRGDDEVIPWDVLLDGVSDDLSNGLALDNLPNLI